MFNAGEVTAILRGQFEPSGFSRFTAANKLAANAATEAEAAIATAQGRSRKASEASAAAAEKSALANSRMGAVASKAGSAGLLVLAAAAFKSVQASAKFEKQLNELKAVSGASVPQMKKLADASLEFGTKSGLGATQAAKAATELAKGGLSNSQIIGGALKGAMDLAQAGSLDLADAAGTVVNALNLFGLKGKDAAHVADAMSTAANATQADVIDFAMALSQGGSAAKQAGLSFDDTVVSLEALAHAGVKNSDAGTSMKTALIQLIKPTQKQADLAKTLGLNFIDANGNMKGMVDIATMLRDRLGGMTKAQRTATLATLAGTDGFRTLASLYDAGPRLIKSYEEGLRKQGTAAETARQKQEGLAGSFQKFKAEAEAVGIEIGQKFGPSLTKGLQAVTKFMDQLRTGKGSVGNFGKDVATIATTLVHAFANIAPAVLAPFKAIAAGIGAAVRTIAAVFRGDFSGALAGIADMVRAPFDAVISVLQGVAGMVAGPAKAVGDAIVSPIKTAVGALSGPINAVLGLFSTFLDATASMFDALAGAPVIGAAFRDAAGPIRQAADQINHLRNEIAGIHDKDVKVNVKKASGWASVESGLADLGGGITTMVGVKKGPGYQGVKGALDNIAAGRNSHIGARVGSGLGVVQGALDAVAHARYSAIGATLGDGLSNVSAALDALAHPRYAPIIATGSVSAGTKASGRSPAKAETAVVGEGAGPEYVVDGRTGKGFKTRGPMLTALGDDDYVIPVEQRYRGRAMGLFGDLAADLGVPGFAGGKGPKATAAKKPARPRYKVPQHIAFGGTDPALIQTDFQNASTALQQAKQAEHDSRQATKKGKGTGKTLGGGKYNGKVHATALARLRKAQTEYTQRKKDSIAAQKNAGVIAGLETDINVYAGQMGVADATVPATDAEAKKRSTDFTTAKDHRTAAIKKLLTMVNRELGLAGWNEREHKGHNTPWVRTLRETLSRLTGDKQTTGLDELDKLDTSATSTPTLDNLLTTTEAAGIDDANRDIALAALTEPLDDDKAAMSRLLGFDQDVLNRLNVPGMPSSIVAEAAGAVKQARDQLASLTSGSTGGQDADVQAQLAQSQERERTATESARINARALEVFQGAGSIGYGPTNNITVNQNNLHPGSPDVLQQAADAVVQGLGYQGNVNSPRQRVG
jgi:TP901 family phage tail tape measure protein